MRAAVGFQPLIQQVKKFLGLHRQTVGRDALLCADEPLVYFADGFPSAMGIFRFLHFDILFIADAYQLFGDIRKEELLHR